MAQEIKIGITPKTFTLAVAGRDYVQLTNTPYDGLYPIKRISYDGSLVDGFWVEGFEFIQPALTTIDGAPFLTETYSNAQVNIVKVNFTDDANIIKWFDEVGRNILATSTGKNGELTLDELETSDTIWTDIISKANVYPIVINK